MLHISLDGEEIGTSPTLVIVAGGNVTYKVVKHHCTAPHCTYTLHCANARAHTLRGTHTRTDAHTACTVHIARSQKACAHAHTHVCTHALLPQINVVTADSLNAGTENDVFLTICGAYIVMAL